MRDLTALRLGGLAFAALMDDALHCPCDQEDVPLCVRCECLFRLAVAATDYAYTQIRRHAIVTTRAHISRTTKGENHDDQRTD